MVEVYIAGLKLANYYLLFTIYRGFAANV